MIRLVGGLPGSGKSYYAANFISKYGEYDNLYKTFVIKKDIKIITNLDDLQIQHDSLDECFQRYGGPSKFFTVSNFQKIRDLWPKAHILVIIDEAQRCIDDELLKDKEVAFFFQYHRHLGIDIFLLTNDIASCSRKVVGLCEFLIEAQPRSKSLPGVFRYKFKDTKGTFLYSQSVRLRQEVFSIYKSFTTDETEKPKNVILHWVVLFFVVLTLGAFGFKFFVSSFVHKKNVVVGAGGKMVEKKGGNPAFNHQSSARVVPKPVVAPAAVPATPPPSVPVVAPVNPPRRVFPPPVRRERSRFASGAVGLPAPVTASVRPDPELPPALPPLPSGWFRAKVSGTIQVNEHRWYSVAGRLLPSSDCKRYDEVTGSAICKQVVAADE